MNSNWPDSVIIYTDGASRGNPGPASLGIYVVSETEEVVCEISEALGNQTNNFAEYTAVLRALQVAKESNSTKVLIRSDSELMVKQMKGEYKVKSAVIKPLFQQCRDLVSQFDSVQFEHVRREYNKEADRLANEALDA